MKQRLIFLIMLSSFLQGCVSLNNPVAAENNVNLGLAYLKEGLTPQAKEKLLMALDEAPDWSVTQDAMGYFFETTGSSVEAEKYYRQALRLSPQSGANLNNYGTFLCRQHRVVEAEKIFLKAANIPAYINTAQAYENAGLCALTLPDKNKAVIYFKKALQQEPGREISTRELKKLHEE